MVVDRLEKKLYEKWHEYKQEYWDHHATPQFKHFAKWIKKEANLSLSLQNTHSNARQLATPSSDPPSRPLNRSGGDSRSNSSDTRNPDQHGRSNSPQRSSNLGQGRPLRDGRSPTRNTRSTTVSQPPPRRSSTPGSGNRDPNSNPVKRDTCAWCTYTRKPAHHTTNSCDSFKTAKAVDQWEALYSHRTCRLCLKGSHPYTDCPDYRGPEQTCSECGYTHCRDIGCNPRPRRPPRQMVNRIGDTQNYSRTCPVILSHPNVQCTVRGLAIIDDQASLTVGF